MFEAVAFLYGMIASVVIAGTNRNHRMGQPHPPLLTALGYVVCGSLIAAAIALLVCAATGVDPFARVIAAA